MMPVIEVVQHGQKCKQGESWMYIATPVGASIESLTRDERLYVGAQTQDRMFRGDGFNGSNYHHAEMRAGNGGDNPVNFLYAGGKIEIHRISASALTLIVGKYQEMHFLKPLLMQPKTSRKHIGYWFEQYVLFAEPKLWRWNTAAAEKSLSKIVTIHA